jgi:membrane protein DedA with SNARE-associated domain
MQSLSPHAWDLGGLIATYGYWVLAVGCLLEGETVLLLAGFAAHRGHLDPVAVLVVASTAGFAGDQFYFWLGRRHGARLLAKRPAWARQAGRVEALLERWDAVFVIGVRFAYGLRIAGPMLMGASAMSARRFAFFNALGAIIWALVVGGLGWAFGEAVQRWMGHWHQFEAALVLALFALVLALWLRRRRRLL